MVEKVKCYQPVNVNIKVNYCLLNYEKMNEVFTLESGRRKWMKEKSKDKGVLYFFI
jgi:hypothetical protein